jgi:hypothetical protein
MATFLGCKFRSHRLDKLGRVTQDSGVKASVYIPQPRGGKKCLTYYGRIKYFLRIRVGTKEEDFVRVRWFRKPKEDTGGNLVVREGEVVSETKCPFVRADHITGQVFYGEDFEEPGRLVILEKEPWRLKGLADAGREEELPDVGGPGGRRLRARGEGEEGGVNAPDGKREARGGVRGGPAEIGGEAGEASGGQETERRGVGREEGRSQGGGAGGNGRGARVEVSSDSSGGGGVEGARVVALPPLHSSAIENSEKPTGLPLPPELRACVQWAFNDRNVLDGAIVAQTTNVMVSSAVPLDVTGKDLRSVRDGWELTDGVSYVIRKVWKGVEFHRMHFVIANMLRRCEKKCQHASSSRCKLKPRLNFKQYTLPCSLLSCYQLPL